MKAIISVIGKDKKGIIARVSNYLYESNINIEDISQTIMEGYFTMIMVVSVQDTKKMFDELSIGLDKLSKDIGVDIKIQHEDIFNKMHKI